MPDEKITRQDIGVLFSRILSKYSFDKSPGFNKGSVDVDVKSTNSEKNFLFQTFSDAKDISAYALEGMLTASKYGLIKGKAGDKLDPLNKATRAEVAVMLYRLLDHK
jgi:hypothetical protein